MMNVEELEVKIKQNKAKLGKLEEAYEKEEDETKINKLQYSMSRVEENIETLIDRQQKLLEREAEDEEKGEPKDKNAEEDDIDVCESCGGDLNQVGEDPNGTAIFECVNCKELYLDE